MALPGELNELCRYITEYESSRYASDPVGLGTIFRDYAGIKKTPSLSKTIDMVRSFGIRINAAEYLESGGTNMMAKGEWHIHYSAKERRATKKFTIFHELFEIIHKSICESDQNGNPMKEPQLSRAADRFAASVLIPPDFFSARANDTGCDLVKLSEDLELSHQCLLIALGQHFADMQFIGLLYEYRPNGETVTNLKVQDFMATVVVKTPRARRVKDLCCLQTVPTRTSRAQPGSLVCAAIKSGCPLLWRSNFTQDAPAILVRPLLSAGKETYRVIVLAVPCDEYSMISFQVDTLEPIPVNGDTACPAEKVCQDSNNCVWRSIGG